MHLSQLRNYKLVSYYDIFVLKVTVFRHFPEINTSIGTPIEFTLNLKNTGKGECMNLKLQLILPEEMELVEGSTEKMLHSLGPQEEFLFTFRIIANDKVNDKINALLTFDDLEESQHTLEMDAIPVVAES